MMESKNIKAELIGSLIKRPNLIAEVYPLMGFKDPLEGCLSDVLSVLVKMYENKQPIGVSAVIRQLGVNGSPIGSEAWQTMLYDAMESVKIPTKAIAYIDEIREGLIVNGIMTAVNNIKLNEGGKHISADNLMDTLESTVLNLRSSIMSDDRVDCGDAQDEIEREIEAYATSNEIPMITTGLWELDRMTGGLGDGDYVCISALNGGGKSLMATTMMLHQSQPTKTGLGKKTSLITLEMSKADIYKRLIHQVSGFDMRAAYSNKMPADEIKGRYAAGKEIIKRFNIDVVAPRSDKVSSLKNLCRTLASNGSKCIYIDYFQLISGDKRLSKTGELEDISDQFRKLAKELNVPIVMLAQQNSEAKQKQGYNGTTGGVSREHISHCKKIARDCHMVLLINEAMDKLIIDKSRNSGDGEIDIRLETVGTLAFVGNKVDTGVSAV